MSDRDAGRGQPKPRGAVAPITLLLAGAGHLAVGKYRRGLLWFVLDAVVLLLGVVALVAVSPSMYWPLLGAVLTVRIASLVDLVRLPAADPTALPSWGKTVLLWIALLAVGWGQAAAVRANLIEAFRIPAGSMIPTLLVGDHIFADKRSRAPRRGDLVVFEHPKHPSETFVKRIVAIGGDTVEIRDGAIWLDGKPVLRRHVDGDCSYEDREETRWTQRTCDAWQESLDGNSYPVIFDKRAEPPKSFPPFKVPPNSFYVLGDNRDNSHDSRYWGSVPNENLKGRPLSIWWSSGGSGVRWDRIGQKLH